MGTGWWRRDAGCRQRETAGRILASSLQLPASSFGLLLLLLLLTGCGGAAEAVVPTFVVPTPGTTTGTLAFLARPTYEVTTATLTEEILVRGELVAAQQTYLSFSISGMIKSTAVRAGQEVTAGERLAELDAPMQQQNLLQRQSNLTIAQLELQKLEQERAGSLDLAIGRERVALAESLYTLAQQQYAASVLMAPFDGTVVAFNKQPGSRVDAYEPVGVLAKLGDMRVRGYLPADSRGRVASLQPAVVRVDGFGSTPFTGVVSQIGVEPISWQAMMAYPVDVTLDPGQDLPGVAQVGVEIALTGETRVGVPWVPNSALTWLGGQAYLDVRTGNGVERVPVETGIVSGQATEVVAGVGAGDVVVLP